MEEEEQDENENEDEDEEEMVILEKGERKNQDGVPMDCRVYRCFLLVSSCLSYIVAT